MYELEIKEENIKKTLESDVLGRNCSIYNFLDLIYSIDTKCTISIDGDWGTGKTFFVKQVEYIMNLLNNSSKENIEPKIQSLIDKIKNKLEEKNIDIYGNVRAIYYNACEYDYFEEPVLTIIADIIKNNSNIEIDNPKVKKGLVEKLDSLLSSFKFGFSYQNQNGNTLGLEVQKQKNESHSSILEEIILDKKLEENFKQLLEDLLVEKSNRLVIFIDELDRCNPKFAVKLLEKIKYFFNDERFIFVFSTNMIQLQHTIEKYYGYNFNGGYYLQKFFDYQLELPEINIEHYINYQIMLIPTNSSYYVDDVIKDILKYKKFNLRDCNKFFELIKLKYNGLKTNNDNIRCYFFTSILFPVLLALKIKDINEYQIIKKGKGKEEFRKIIQNCNHIMGYLTEEIKITNVDNTVIDEIYDYTFIRNDDEGIVIGNNFSIQRSYITRMFDKLSFLGEKNTL